jgi:hypothetical protein
LNIHLSVKIFHPRKELVEKVDQLKNKPAIVCILLGSVKIVSIHVHMTGTNTLAKDWNDSAIHTSTHYFVFDLLLTCIREDEVCRMVHYRCISCDDGRLIRSSLNRLKDP